MRGVLAPILDKYGVAFQVMQYCTAATTIQAGFACRSMIYPTGSKSMEATMCFSGGSLLCGRT